MRYLTFFLVAFFPFVLLGCGSSSDRPSDEMAIKEITKDYESSLPSCEDRAVNSVEIEEWSDPRELQNPINGEERTVHVVRAHVSVECSEGMLSESGNKDYDTEYVFWRNEFDEWEHDRKGFGF